MNQELGNGRVNPINNSNSAPVYIGLNKYQLKL